MRPLTLVLCALLLAGGTALAVALLTHSPAPPPVTTIELGATAPSATPASEFAPPLDDDAEDPDEDPFDDAD